ncbi:MAG: DNA mismatch repair endonuclease MutL [Deltaproteobacteria bacterium]|nr:DNA mismatch repair endonuclease MutL [Deltaproteobacteria bacterium]
MNRIGILPPEVASKIAAGEVITRPASVVKELAENALDAGARTITVEIMEGGCRQIRVTDDGCGMWPEEAPLSLLRHATSKLRQDTDLLHLKTMGFRGEALPSIAAVSRLELCTRSPELELGCRISVEGGVVRENVPWAGPPGTQVSVADLFYNTPARRKFLRSKAAEQGQIVELLRHLAMGYPEIHFSVLAQGKTVFQTPAHGDCRERLAALLGLEWADKMLPLEMSGPGLRLTGLIAGPDHHVATSKYQFFLVNRRIVSDRLVAGAIRQAYQGLLPRGRHPVLLLHLETGAEQVDINVHPTKAEVRFKDSGRVYGLILTAISEALQPTQMPGRQEFASPWTPPPPLKVQESQPAALFGELPPLPRNFLASPSPAPLPTAAPVGPGWRFADLPVLGQLQGTYILAQAPEGLLIIDQHAAHERILYEIFSRASEEVPARQTLLFPLSVELDPAGAAWAEVHLAELWAAGVELEPFGGATFLVRAAPACLAEQDLAALVPEMIAELAQLPGEKDREQLRRRLHLTLACRGAVKAGQRLSDVEIHHLLKQLDESAVSSHCPHGRPLWRLLTLPEIRQNFRRPRH